ncbi:family 43 glycosylhydrolase [Pseudoduganella albidiflava]|uniref:Xylosidase n=1 Tax=Pseudoduganella albidiflava TaxID=321983 RepID=A0A411WYU6_9BURK|nr:family 43 glycosylhydrolase [Pseudoduganella albidiflava]QBI01871.1 xylan 1,4-beta-xylosidase [Pseudoduganella albidiflava]GGY38995.1 xylosidase [Pseudoduganella albidiflava]
MTNQSRRNAFKTILASTAALPAAHVLGQPSTPSRPDPATATATATWARGIEGQRKADLGDGRYVNPIVSGDHPDPTILKDGDDYYMTFSSFFSYPGIVIWHSTDLVNWAPVGPALRKPLGTIWALDLCKHDGRYFIYIPAAPDGNTWSIYAIWADRIEGPWSDPVDLKIAGCIDPGHILGEDGRRYLFVNGIRKIRLTDDGLATDGKLEEAYKPWRYPEDWVVENFAPEGPKLLRRGDWFYLVTAVGGTAGPVTGHMVIAARSKSVHGPWEHCPRNPLVRTTSTSEPWWSRGHATLVEGPAGDWWMVYHGYENGYRTLGRQTLLEPVEWTDDGWFRARGGDLSQPLPKPRGKDGLHVKAGRNGQPLSDDFTRDRFGIQWSFHDPKPDDMDRARYLNPGLRIQGKGTSPADSSPLTCGVGDRSYQADVTLELDGQAEAGLLLFYNHKAFVGVGFAPDAIKTWEYAEEQPWMRVKRVTRSVRVRLTNVENVVTFHYSYDGGKTWLLHGLRMEVSGIHHNVFGGFLSLKIGIYCVGDGAVTLRDFRYRAL